MSERELFPLLVGGPCDGQPVTDTIEALVRGGWHAINFPSPAPLGVESYRVHVHRDGRLWLIHETLEPITLTRILDRERRADGPREALLMIEAQLAEGFARVPGAQLVALQHEHMARTDRDAFFGLGAAPRGVVEP